MLMDWTIGKVLSKRFSFSMFCCVSYRNVRIVDTVLIPRGIILAPRPGMQPKPYGPPKPKSERKYLSDLCNYLEKNII